MRVHALPKAVILLCLLALGAALVACAPAQDASRARSEYVARHGATIAAREDATEWELLRGIMPADEIRVEEYLNYYEQSFPAPPEGHAVALYPLLGNTHVPADGGTIWLQIGLQAAEVPLEELRPVNLALVLDKSGSMADADKMTYLKRSLHILLQQLHAEDLLSIVAYDTEARVLLPAGTVGDGSAAREAIDALQPGGSTNLHAGLMLGYEQAAKYAAPEHNNRVILLTDGIANQGVTEPDRIAADSLAYNREGIYLSTIGLGLDFNDELLSTLAEQGRGNYHFVSDADEMERVFKNEVAGLVQTMASDVFLELQLADEAQVQRVYGYDYDLQGDTLQVQFDDAGAGRNQLLIVKMVMPAGDGEDLPLATARLTYRDAATGEEMQEKVPLNISYGAPSPYDPLVAPSVRRNVTLLQLAETLQQVSFLVDQKEYQQALDLVREIKPRVWEISTQEGDEEMEEDVQLLENYETILGRLVGLQGESESPGTDA